MITAFDHGQACPISDADIDAADPSHERESEFIAWRHSHIDANGHWTDTRWHRWTNANHIRFLAELMDERGEWIGPDPIVTLIHVADGNQMTKVLDGNHRVRACMWLAAVRGIKIEAPEVAEAG